MSRQTTTRASRSASRSHSRNGAHTYQALRKATAGVATAAGCRYERLERRCMMAHGVIGGIVYDDANFSGAIEISDPPVPGITVFADVNNNGTREFDEPTSVSDANGAYQMQMPTGTVVIRQLLKDGWEPVAPAGGAAVVTISDRPVLRDFLIRRRLDWGDAPDGPFAPGYPTTLANNGARHQVLNGYSLGKRIDAEPNGQPNANATGDDLGAPGDDEDGVVFLTPLVGGSAGTVQVNLTNTVGLTAILNGWLDANIDGQWDPSEQVISQMLVAGPNMVMFNVPPGTVAGPSFMRFRLSPNGLFEPKGTGYAGTTPLHGEVEDYQVRLEREPEQQFDFGDAPDTPNAAIYPTLLVHSGAFHEILPSFTLGDRIDAEANGQPNATATGDDLALGDDEDGVTFIDPLVAGSGAKIDVFLNSPTDGFLDAWFDWNADGNWTGAGEHVFVDQVLVPGVNSLIVNVPATAKEGTAFARFRLAQQPGAVTTPSGFGFRGEVEDYNPRVSNPPPDLDWGDAPEIPGTILKYPTLATSNGARHRVVNNFMLGGKIDAEPDGQPTILSDGDDTNGSDDHDGVVILTSSIPGGSATFQVFLTSATNGKLDAWIDWNQDGNWTQPGDRIATSFNLVPGANTLVVPVPATAAPGETYSRFRLSFNGGLWYDGFGFEGEVEDYTLKIDDPKDRKLDWGDAPQSPTGGPPNYPTLAAANGARHLIRDGFHMGIGVDAELDGQPTLGAIGDDVNGVPDDEDGVKFVTPIIPGGTAEIHVMAPMGGVLDAWIDFHANSTWSEAVDRIATTHPLVPGLNILHVSVPADAKPGETYSRFRLSPNGVASYDGFGYDGEVEDYVNKIEPRGEFDWGDARKNYPTLAVNDGAHHKARPDFVLGDRIDVEPDGQPSAAADRDDLVAADDEDGVFLPGGSLEAGVNNVIVVTTNSPGSALDAWLDLNYDGDWDDPGEQIFGGAFLGANVNNLNYFVPFGTPTGEAYARFRLSRSGGLTYKGFGGEGEVEDYLFKIRNGQTPVGSVDWGDAPQAYPTLTVQNGARHTSAPGFTLGKNWDAEPDGQPSPDALRDDLVGIADDEDGVQFLSPIVAGGVLKVAVDAPNGGTLDAWLDWAGDLDWTDANDRIFTAQPLVAGLNFFAVPVPAGLKPETYRSFSRFRLSRNGVASFTGAGGDGEVEDYQVIVNGPTVTIDPHTGILHVAGTDGDDHVGFAIDPDTGEMGVYDPAAGFFFLKNTNAPETLDEVLIQLNGGNDHAEVARWNFENAWPTKWNGAGGVGQDTFVVDSFIATADVDVIIGPEYVGLGPLDLFPREFERMEAHGGTGDDRFLAVGLGGPDTMPDQLVLGGGEGDDSFYVVGNNLTAVQVDGGPQHPGGAGDSLSLFGDMTGFANYTPTGGASDAGIVAIGFDPQPDPPASTIQFTGLEPVNISGFAAFTLQTPAGPVGSDSIRVDPLSLPGGNATMLSGLADGIPFEHAVVSNVGALTLDVATNDLGPVTNDVVDFNGSILGAASFTMPAGLAELNLNVNAGVIPFNWDPGALGGRVHTFVANDAVARFEKTQHLTMLALADGANAFVAAGGTNLMALVELDVQGTGTLDLADNDMIVHKGDIGSFVGGAYTGLTGLIQRAYNFTAWDKPGITTSMPDASTKQLTTLGIARAADILFLNPGETGVWNDETVSADAVLIKYTYSGDVNFDGLIDGADYGTIDNWVQFPGTWGYANGDFNFDGVIDGADYGLIDNAVQLQGPPL